MSRGRLADRKEEEDMFEALFRIVVQVETDEEGQRAFSAKSGQDQPVLTRASREGDDAEFANWYGHAAVH